MKRLIVCCDGTWEDSDQGMYTDPSNVTLLARAILQESVVKKPGTEQIVLYQPGIGTSLSTFMRDYEGAFGIGLMQNVREAYGFVSVNWNKGDEIYIFGFSRGAYTARSVAGLISQFGLLTKRGMDGIGYVLDAYQASKFQGPDGPANIAQLAAKYERKAGPAPIKMVGVFDTVGSLGIPDFYILGQRVALLDDLLAKFNKKYQFSDVDIHPNIEFAIQALALNEHRAPFSPTLWNLQPDNKRTTLKQCWFPGYHGNVGGSDTTHDLSDISMAWMVQQITNFTDLEYSTEYLLASRKTFGPNKMNIPWGCAPIQDTDTGVFLLAGSKPRTPGKYLSDADIKKGVKTNEFYHRVVAVRAQALGKSWTFPSVAGLPEEAFGPVEQKLSWVG